MREVGESDDLIWEFVEAERLPGSLIEQEDVVGLVSDKTEGVEVVEVHELGVIHDLISL